MEDQSDEIRGKIKELLIDCGYNPISVDFERPLPNNVKHRIHVLCEAKDAPNSSLLIDATILYNRKLRIRITDRSTFKSRVETFTSNDPILKLFEFIKDELTNLQFTD
ncbi:MAG: hypothetical protein IIC00_10435 [Planctomycetes bacterium]|nr:hypothetical protein [Planctomycetota bacterium]